MGTEPIFHLIVCHYISQEGGTFVCFGIKIITSYQARPSASYCPNRTVQENLNVDFALGATCLLDTVSVWHGSHDRKSGDAAVARGGASQHTLHVVRLVPGLLVGVLGVRVHVFQGLVQALLGFALALIPH